MKLDIEEISSIRSFVFLWCGSGEGLDLGRMVQISQSHTQRGIFVFVAHITFCNHNLNLKCDISVISRKCLI